MPLPTGLRFGLTQDIFNQWWYTALYPEQAREYIDFHRGNLDGARFVCALDHLTNVDGRGTGPDVITQAYCIANDLPDADMGSVIIRQQAQVLYESPAVQALMEAVRSKGRRLTEELIAQRALKKIDELYDRASTEAFEEYGDKISTEKLALDASLRFMTNVSKERALEADRRNAKSYKEAIEKNREKNTQLPPTLPEIKQFLSMFREKLTPDEWRELTASMQDLELPAAPIEPAPSE
jgi:hypothetical protein